LIAAPSVDDLLTARPKLLDSSEQALSSSTKKTHDYPNQASLVAVRRSASELGLVVNHCLSGIAVS